MITSLPSCRHQDREREDVNEQARIATAMAKVEALQEKVDASRIRENASDSDDGRLIGNATGTNPR